MGLRRALAAFATAALLACGGSVHESREGQGGASGAISAAGHAGAAGWHTGGSSGKPGAGGSSSKLQDCGPDEDIIAEIPELHENGLWLMAVAAAVTPTTLYVAFHDGNHYNVDRIYAMPRCGGTPQLIASELGSLSPSSLSAASGQAYAVNAGKVGGSSAKEGELLRLKSWGVDKIAAALEFPLAVRAIDDDVYFLGSTALQRFSNGVVTQIAKNPGSFSTGLTIDGQHAYVSGAGQPMRRVDLTTGATTEFAAVPAHQLADDAARVFACALYDTGPLAVAIDKTNGQLTELGECSIPLVILGESLFLGTPAPAMIREFDLSTLAPGKEWYVGAEAIAVDDLHVFGAAYTTIWRGHR